jgi:hypothetical protein
MPLIGFAWSWSQSSLWIGSPVRRVGGFLMYGSSISHGLSAKDFQQVEFDSTLGYPGEGPLHGSLEFWILSLASLMSLSLAL